MFGATGPISSSASGPLTNNPGAHCNVLSTTGYPQSASGKPCCWIVRSSHRPPGNLVQNPVAKIDLEVRVEQKEFVATNAVSLIQATYETDVMWHPKAVYTDDKIVGFVMYGVARYKDKDVWDFCRLMIDKSHQGKGYGKEAVRSVIEAMQNVRPDIHDVYISFVPENTGARKLYTSAGFHDVGMSQNK